MRFWAAQQPKTTLRTIFSCVTTYAVGFGGGEAAKKERCLEGAGYPLGVGTRPSKPPRGKVTA